MAVVGVSKSLNRTLFLVGLATLLVLSVISICVYKSQDSLLPFMNINNESSVSHGSVSSINSDKQLEEVAKVDQTQEDQKDQVEQNQNHNGSSFIKSEYKSATSPYKRVEFLSPTLINHNNNSVLILVLIGPKSPFGRDRNFEEFMATIGKLYANSETELTISMGFLINVEEEFDKVVQFFDLNFEKLIQEAPTPISRITVSTNTDLDKNLGFSRDHRHDSEVQRLRRRAIAKNRNYLTISTLKDEQYLLFLDSDIIDFERPHRILSTFIESGKDIIVPRISKGANVDYDLNSWKGKRPKPNDMQLKLLDEGKIVEAAYYPEKVEAAAGAASGTLHFRNFLHDKEYSEFRHNYKHAVELDSVGGAMLFMKADVFRMGANFPTSYIVGTTWDRSEGYDGIETEGICYLAKPLGFKCWGYPNVVGIHSPG
ncbi:Anp1-domain-containing protein [Scheffersomyces amazonensis]|uniref:Anp1-domain-containing protein n=1 Tax=Scheffersomyces amazonensis TaxID=1078765 RepID=UPI00315C8263